MLLQGSAFQWKPVLSLFDKLNQNRSHPHLNMTPAKCRQNLPFEAFYMF